MKKNSLSVRPVRKYRTPKYPSWQDPNPLQHPETVPYPLRSRIGHILAASGLTSTLFMTAQQCSVQDAPNNFGIHPDSLYNSFTSLRAGLPYHFPAYGTGQPERFSEKEIRPIIEKVFAAHGFHLQPDYPFQSGNNIIHFNGFDPERKTGYVFIYHNRLDTDALVNPFGRNPWLSYSHLKYVSDFLVTKEDSKEILSEDFVQKLTRLQQKTDTAEWQLRLRQAVLENYLERQEEYAVPELLRKEMHAVLHKAPSAKRSHNVEKYAALVDLMHANFINIEIEPEKFKLYKHLVDAYGEMGRFPFSSSDFEKIVRVIRYSENCWPSANYYTISEVERKEAEDAFRKKQADIFSSLSASGEELMRHMEALNIEADGFFVSLSDIRLLDSLSQRGELFVAPLSQFDSQLEYRMDSEELFAQLQQEIKITEEMKDQARLEELKKWQHDYKAFQLTELEKNMHRYLLWARAQGKY